MSTVRMKRDDGGRKAGQCYSVPFLVARQMIAAGAAEYAPGAKALPVAKPPEPPKAAAPKIEPPAVQVEPKGGDSEDDKVKANKGKK